MSTRVEPPTDNPPMGCTDVEFAVWAAGFRKRRAGQLAQLGTVHPDRIKEMVETEVAAARRRTQALKSEVQ